MAQPNMVEVEVGGKPYRISTFKIPYFASYLDFQSHAGQGSRKHDDIPYFEAAYQGAEKGLRHCFRNLDPDITAYHTLCDTLDFLCIDILGGRSLEGVIQDLKEGKGYYDDDYKRPTLMKGDKRLARDSCFRLLYLMMKADLEDDTKIAQKIYQAVVFVVSHRAIFKYRARKLIRAAYEERFTVTPKQLAELDRWPILEPGLDSKWSDNDVTTEENSDPDTDADFSD